MVNSVSKFFKAYFSRLLGKKSFAIKRKEKILELLQTTKPILFFGFSHWKQEFYSKLFQSETSLFLRASEEKDEDIVKEIFAKIRDQKVYVWSYKDPFWLSALSERNNVTICRVEDGFLRSVGLGAEKTAPSSIVIEEGTNLHFHKDRDSRLHHIIRSLSADELEEYHHKGLQLQDLIVGQNLTKYNFRREPVQFDVPDESILVLGQVESDESIRRGPDPYFTCEKLIEAARRENPGCQIHFKPHPEVAKGFAKPYSAPFLRYPDLIEFPQEANMFDYAGQYKKVYTISSLAGFEMLLRGASVKVFGAPWYAGWGVTDDQAIPREEKKGITIQVLLWAAYVMYPNYYDKVGNVVDVFRVIDEISNSVNFKSIMSQELE